jgi:putative peptidoglycan lipid II flippase
LLAVVVGGLVLIGVLATPLLIGAIAPGFSGPKRELTIEIVRVLFPGAGLLVLSAWCLGVLNSHHRFLLSYTAPVVWNAAMIATLVWYRHAELPRLAVLLAWGSVAGSALQFAAQVPVVLRVAPDLRFTLDLASAHVRTVVRNFVPVLVSRGVVQLSAYVDTWLASWLPTGAVTGLSNATLLYTLPVSLFGMSVSASELPEMSRARGDAAEVAAYLRQRLGSGLRRIAFLVVPSAVAFLALGDLLSAAVYQTGRFKHADALYVWAILAGSGVGLLASTLGRLYSSTFYALRDTRTPLRFAFVRVALTTGLGWFCALVLPGLLGLDPRWGAAGLTASAGVAGWVEYLLLSRGLGRRIGATGLPLSFILRLWLAAAAAAALAWGAKLGIGGLDGASTAAAAHPLVFGALVLGLYGAAYFAAAAALGLPEARATLARLPGLR